MTGAYREEMEMAQKVNKCYKADLAPQITHESSALFTKSKLQRTSEPPQQVYVQVS